MCSLIFYLYTYCKLDEMPKMFLRLLNNFDCEMKSSINNFILQGKLCGAPKKAYYTYLLFDIEKFNKYRSSFNTNSFDPIEPSIFDFILFKACIFYVGKGIALRKHVHLTIAKKHYYGLLPKRKIVSKITKISSFWKQNKGVTLIQLDCDATTYEAATRENCIIKSLNFNLLTNQIRGTSYGVVKTWPLAKVRNYGDILLFHLFRGFLCKTPNIIYAHDVVIKAKRSLKLKLCKVCMNSI